MKPSNALFVVQIPCYESSFYSRDCQIIIHFFWLVRYHLIYNPPRTNEVKQRLQTVSTLFLSNFQKKIVSYGPVVQKINTSLSSTVDLTVDNY